MLPSTLNEAFEAYQADLIQGQPVPYPERLGDCYEGLRAGSLERRQGGAHYTPEILTGPMVAATLSPSSPVEMRRRYCPLQWSIRRWGRGLFWRLHADFWPIDDATR